MNQLHFFYISLTVCIAALIGIIFVAFYFRNRSKLVQVFGWAFGISLIATLLMAMGCWALGRFNPTLAQKIVNNMKDNPADWRISIENDTTNVAYHGANIKLPEQRGYLINDKCGIKLERISNGYYILHKPNFYVFTTVMDNRWLEREYDAIFIEPREEQAQAKQDSLKEQQEQTIVNNICK